MKVEEKQEILEFLKNHKLMSVGTYNKFPWAANVFYLFDEDFNLYFVSNPKTLHCMNIAKNPKVSVTVADSHQTGSSKKVGFQARGLATRVTGAKEVQGIIKAWNKRKFDNTTLTYKVFMKVWNSRFYKIKLTDIKLFDEHQAEENEDRMWKI